MSENRFESIMKQRPLSKEQERELGILMEKGGPTGKRAADKLVAANLRFVMKLAHKFKGYGPYEDLVQEGCLGMMQAIRLWDYRRDLKFISYAAWWIRAYIYRYMMANHSLVKGLTTTSARSLFFHIKRKVAELEAKGVSTSEAVDRVTRRQGMSREAAAAFYSYITNKPISLDYRDEEGQSFGKLIPSSDPNPEQAMLEKERVEIVRHHMNKAVRSPRDARIVRDRVLSDTPVTLGDLGDAYDLSRERARQLEAAIKKRFEQSIKNSEEGIELRK